MEAYSPLGTPGNPLSEGAPRVIDDPVITDIAEKHNTSVAQVYVQMLTKNIYTCIFFYYTA